MNDQDLTVSRWRRYGKDRLYVEQPDGARVGWWDLATDEAHPETPEHLPTLIRTVDGWKASQTIGTTVTEPAAPAPSPDAAAASVVVVSPEPAPLLAPLSEVVAAPEPQALALAAPPAGAPDRPWLDLSANRAGAEAREQAQALRAAAPVKTTLARVLGVHTDERAWRIGADGEELVAAQLAKTARKDARWRFLHAIPVGERGSDIDHLIVGPGGVFTVNAKHHPKAKIWVGGNTFMVNGNRQPYVRNSRHEASRAARLLAAACGFPVHVEGLIVTVNAADVVIKTQPDGVSVTWRNNLAKWLLAHGDLHTPATLDAIYEAARRSTTWQP